MLGQVWSGVTVQGTNKVECDLDEVIVHEKKREFVRKTLAEAILDRLMVPKTFIKTCYHTPGYACLEPMAHKVWKLRYVIPYLL